MKKIVAFALSLALVLGMTPHSWASGKDQVVLSTENSKLAKKKGTVSIDGQKKEIQFNSDAGHLVIACSEVTNITYTKNAKELKKAVAAEVAAAPFTLGLSLIGLAFKSHGNYMLLAYGNQQQAAFKLDNGTYAERLQAASACAGKPVQTIGK